MQIVISLNRVKLSILKRHKRSDTVAYIRKNKRFRYEKNVAKLSLKLK